MQKDRLKYFSLTPTTSLSLCFQRYKNFIFYLTIYILTCSILYVLFRHVGIHQIAAWIKKSNPIYVCYAFILSIIIVTLSGFKFKLFVSMMGQNIQISRCIKLSFAILPLNTMIPSKGGDFLKSWSIKDILPLSHGIGIVILERFIDVFVLCSITLLCSVLISQFEISVISFSVILIMFLFIYLIHNLLFKKYNKNNLIQKMRSTAHPLKCLYHNKKYLLYILSVSLMVWICSILQVYLLYLSIGQPVPIFYSFTAVPIAIFIGLMPITIAGMGTRDLALVYLFSSYADNSSSIAVGIYLSLLRYWILSLIGLAFIKTLKGRKGVEDKS